MNTNFKVIGLTQFGIKIKSTAPEANALTTPPSKAVKKLLNCLLHSKMQEGNHYIEMNKFVS